MKFFVAVIAFWLIFWGAAFFLVGCAGLNFGADLWLSESSDPAYRAARAFAAEVGCDEVLTTCVPAPAWPRYFCAVGRTPGARGRSFCGGQTGHVTFLPTADGARF